MNKKRKDLFQKILLEDESVRVNKKNDTFKVCKIIFKGVPKYLFGETM